MDDQSARRARQERLAMLRARNRERRAAQAAASILSTQRSASFAGILDPGGDLCSPSWVHQRLAHNSLQPFASIRDDADGLVLAQWLYGCLEQLGLEDQYLVSLGAEPEAAWAVMRVTDSRVWLYELWSQL